MSPFDATPQHRGSTDPRPEQEVPAIPVDLVDELRQPHSGANLARGIVWADVVAAIAADEEERQQRAAETPRRLRNAA